MYNPYYKKQTDYQKKVCIHINDDKDDCWQYFTGKGIQFYVICGHCARMSDLKAIPFRDVDDDYFDRLLAEINNYWEGITGLPEELHAEAMISLPVESYRVTPLAENKICGGVCGHSKKGVSFYLLNDHLHLIQFTICNKEIIREKIVVKNIHTIDVKSSVLMYISENDRYIVLANRYGQFAHIIDLRENRVINTIDRKDYYIDHCEFPLAFFTYNDKQYLVHASAWNRLDIFDCDERKSVVERLVSRENHYLDYFYGILSISPGSKRIATAGWGWSPVGFIRSWDLMQWINNNQYESEDGDSLWDCHVTQNWDFPVTWIDDDILAVSGYNWDDGNWVDGVVFYNVAERKLSGWFPGPDGAIFYYIGILISISNEGRITLWNTDKGECIFDKTVKGLTLFCNQSGALVTVDGENIAVAKIPAPV